MAGGSIAHGACPLVGRKLRTANFGKDGVFSFNTGGSAKDTAARKTRARITASRLPQAGIQLLLNRFALFGPMTCQTTH
jgi:hypothetical protein